MKDNMSLYQGISDSYKTMPLSVLHDLLSVLEITIKERHEEWESVGRGGKAETVFTVENNVIMVDFKRGKE